MNILAIGDVVGLIGTEFLASHLPAIKKMYGVDITIANGENSAEGNGISPHSAERLFNLGVDIITTGNHVFRRKEIPDYLEETPNIIRPANYPKGAPGTGVLHFDMGRYQLCVINLMGCVFMDALDNPFTVVDQILEDISTPFVMVDFHAEATSEKIAMAHYLDGRVSALFGTHTHVQTADERIFPKGMGYITDLGMTGPLHSVLGVRPENAIYKFKTHMPARFETAQGECMINGAVFTLNDKTAKCERIERINITK